MHAGPRPLSARWLADVSPCHSVGVLKIASFIDLRAELKVPTRWAPLGAVLLATWRPCIKRALEREILWNQVAQLSSAAKVSANATRPQPDADLLALFKVTELGSRLKATCDRMLAGKDRRTRPGPHGTRTRPVRTAMVLRNDRQCSTVAGCCWPASA